MTYLPTQAFRSQIKIYNLTLMTFIKDKEGKVLTIYRNGSIRHNADFISLKMMALSKNIKKVK